MVESSLVMTYTGSPTVYVAEGFSTIYFCCAPSARSTVTLLGPLLLAVVTTVLLPELGDTAD